MPTVRHLKAILEAEDRTTPVLGRVGGALKLLGGIAAAIGAYQIGRQLVHGITESVKAAAEAEAVDNRLAVAIKNSGQSVASVLPAMQAFATALQRTTGYSDEAVKSGQVLLVTIGKLRADGLERATQAALNFSAATGTDLNASFLLLAKAAAGNTQALSRYGLVLDETIPPAEKFTALLAQMEQQFGGQAAARLNTFTGQVELLTQNFDDLKEAIGTQVMPILTAFLRDFLNPLINGVTDGVNSTTGLRDLMVQLAQSFVPVLSGLEVLAKNLQLLISIANLASGDVAKFILGVGYLREAFDTTHPLADKFGESLKHIGDQGLKAATAIMEVSDAASSTAGFADIAKLSSDIESATAAASLELFQLNQQVTSLGGAILTAQDAVGRFAQDGVAVLNLQLEDTKSKIEDAATTMRRAFRDAGVNAAFAVGDALVDAAERGAFSFKEFARSVLADFARIITQALITRAIVAAIGGGSGTSWVSNVAAAGTGSVTVPVGGASVSPSISASPALVMNMQIDARGATPGTVTELHKVLRDFGEQIEARIAGRVRRGGRYAEAFR